MRTSNGIVVSREAWQAGDIAPVRRFVGLDCYYIFLLSSFFHFFFPTIVKANGEEGVQGGPLNRLGRMETVMSHELVACVLLLYHTLPCWTKGLGCFVRCPLCPLSLSQEKGKGYGTRKGGGGGGEKDG